MYACNLSKKKRKEEKEIRYSKKGYDIQRGGIHLTSLESSEGERIDQTLKERKGQRGMT